MAAVNPGWIHATHFRSEHLDQVVNEIARESKELIQVVAGERGTLHVLGNVLNEIQKEFLKYTKSYLKFNLHI
jgi:ferric-dicitrate binding protein FerR (iron transport regulator)